MFLAVETPAALEQIASLRDQIARDGAIWVVRPKGRDDLTEGMVIAAGRGAGMHDIKIARISATHTGMKFVIPVEQRLGTNALALGREPAAVGPAPFDRSRPPSSPSA